MGFWAGVKHALNSTLGTENFQSLDKMIVNQTRMVESNNLYANLANIESSSTTPSEIIRKESSIKMIRPGRAYLKGVCSRSRVQNITAKFEIFKNGSLIYSWNRNYGSGELEESFNVLITFSAYDVIEFKTYMKNFSDSSTSQTFKVKNLSINGDIVSNIFLENS